MTISASLVGAPTVITDNHQQAAASTNVAGEQFYTLIPIKLLMINYYLKSYSQDMVLIRTDV